MQLWDDILYPGFRNTIRGEYYGIITRETLDEECFNLALRAIAAFKFPRISTEYEVFYAVWTDDNTLQEISEEQLELYPEAVQHGVFNNDLTYAEIEVIIAWMKFYWAEMQISNADNFEEMYTDANIKTFSRANAVDKNLKLVNTYREYAQELETNYGRVTPLRKASIGDINE